MGSEREIPRHYGTDTPEEFEERFKGCEIRDKRFLVVHSNHGPGLLIVTKRAYRDGGVEYYVQLKPDGYPDYRWEGCSGWFESAEDAVEMSRRELGVVLDIDNKTKTPAKEKPSTKNHSANCAITCGEPGFWKFLTEVHDYECSCKETAAAFVRDYCGIQSRKELNTNSDAATGWAELRKSYQDWRAS